MKRSYHTDVMIQYKLGILPPEIIKQIPSSTTDNWKKRDIHRYFGMDNISDYEKNLAMMKDFLSRKALLNAAKALYYIYCVYVKLFEKVMNKKSIFRQSGKTISKTIDQVKGVIGQAKALKAFGISHQQYYAWKRIRKCIISPASLCRKVYHNQLTTKEVDTIRPLDHTRVYLYFLVDNYSRFILNWKASLVYSAEITFKNISEAYDKYHLNHINPNIDLICDGGSENKGKVDAFVNKQATNIQKLIAQTDIIFSNSMVEAVNKRMKYDFLFTTKLLNIEQTKQYLIYAVEQYNNKPHSSLFGLTPHEVFNGAIPDKDMFRHAIRQAASKRKEINLRQECLNCI